MRTPKHKNSWREEMTERWCKLVILYNKVKKSPSFKLWLKILLELMRMILQLVIKKIFDHFFNDL